jgi:hypothetical protein
MLVAYDRALRGELIQAAFAMADLIRYGERAYGLELSKVQHL